MGFWSQYKRRGTSDGRGAALLAGPSITLWYAQAGPPRSSAIWGILGGGAYPYFNAAFLRTDLSPLWREADGGSVQTLPGVTIPSPFLNDGTHLEKIRVRWESVNGIPLSDWSVIQDAAP